MIEEIRTFFKKSSLTLTGITIIFSPQAVSPPLIWKAVPSTGMANQVSCFNGINFLPRDSQTLAALDFISPERVSDLVSRNQILSQPGGLWSDTKICLSIPTRFAFKEPEMLVLVNDFHSRSLPYQIDGQIFLPLISN